MRDSFIYRNTKLITSTRGWIRRKLLLIERRDVLAHRLLPLYFWDQQRIYDLCGVLLIGHLRVSIRSDANGIDLTLTYISISFTEFMRARKSHERENLTCVQAYL